MGFRITTYKAFSPSEISGLVAWWDASTLTGADGSAVSALYDSSGNNVDMYMSTVANQPILKSNNLNNRNVIEFDGSSDFLNVTAPFDNLPTSYSTIQSVSFSNNGNFLYHANGAVSPFHVMYKRNGDRFTRLPNLSPLTSVTAMSGASWSSDDTYFSVTSQSGSRLFFFKRSGDTFTKLADPTAIPNSTMYACHYSSDDAYVATCGAGTVRLYMYKRAGDVFTRIVFTPNILAGTMYATRFSPDNNFLAVGGSSLPYIHIYSKDGDVLTKLADPSSLPVDVYSISWLSETIFACCGNNNTIYIYEYDNASTFQLQQSFTIPTGVAFNCEYSRSKDLLVVGTSLSPFMYFYQVSGTTYTLISNPVSPILSSNRGISFCNNDNYLAMSTSSAPFLTVYKKSGSSFVNLNKLNILRNVSGATMFMVIKHNTTAYNSVPLNIASGTTAGYRAAFFTGTTNKYQLTNRILDSDSAQSITGVTDVSTNWIIITGVLNFATRNRRIYINGRLDAQNNSMNGTGTTTSNTDSLSIFLGRYTSSGYQFNGRMADSLVFNRVLTDDEISNMHKYLSVKWGITLEA